MGAVWFVGRAELRRRWGSVIVLTLLVGLVAAVVLASVAGARRTSTAFARFQNETLAPNLTIFVPTVDDAVIDELRAVPGVEAIGVGRQYSVTIDDAFISAGGAADANFGRTVDRARVLEGRRARPDRADEVVLPEKFAKATGAKVGDTVTLHGFTPTQIQEVLAGSNVTEPQGPEVPLTVVGITRVPSDLSLEGGTGGVVLTTQAFTRRYGDQIGSFSGRVLRVRTTDADAARRFVRIARARTASLGQPGEFQVQPTSETGSAVGESTGIVATGLLVFALVAALAGLVTVTAAVRRYVDGGAAALPALRGLGVSRRDRTLALAFPVAPIVVGGSVLGVIGAWLGSALFPLGLARRAEPHLGLDVDGLVLGVGLLVTVSVVGVLGLAAAWAAMRAEVPTGVRARVRPSRASTAAVAAGCVPAVTVGMGMALDPGRGRTPVPVRSALAGAVVAVLGIVAVGVMAAGLDGLTTTPRAFGYNWDAHLSVDEPAGLAPATTCDPTRSPVVDDRAVAAAADTCQSPVEVAGYSVTGIGFTPLKGEVGPTVLAGRAPQAPDEVALATKTLGEIGASIGDRVRIAGPMGSHRYRVVGRIVMPLLDEPGNGLDTVQAVADGAVFTGAGIDRFSDSARSKALVVLRWRPGADVDAAAARFADLPGSVSRPLGPRVPLEVDRLEQLRVLPWLLGGFLAVIGMLAVGYGVVSAVNRRGRELAVLKTLGFRRRQVYETIGTQASVFGLVGLGLGIPLGVIVGRAAWNVVADRTGLASVPAVPVVAVIAFAVLTLLLVNLVSLLPARRASRLRPAVVLRSE